VELAIANNHKRSPEAKKRRHLKRLAKKHAYREREEPFKETVLTPEAFDIVTIACLDNYGLPTHPYESGEVLIDAKDRGTLQDPFLERHGIVD
jgi:hypothetical protein